MINTTIGFQSVQATVSTTAINLVTFGFTQEEVDSANRCLICVNTNSIRVDWSGVNAPTTTVGLLVNTNTIREIIGNENIQQLQLIRNGASDSEVFVILES